MPRYRYYCNLCDKEFMIFHGINEEFDTCTICQTEGEITKLLSSPVVIKNVSSDNKKIGDLTKEYIKANKEILDSEKKEAKDNTYEPP